MPTATRTFRVFVSSTFEDLKAERDALQRDVFPKLRQLCEENGARFQAIDLRWGVRDEAALDQQTMEICLREIERCQETGIKPNFIVLLGDRYGWRPLPARIEAKEFERVRDHVADADDQQLIKDWYERDDNADPPEYLLKLRTGEFVDRDRWGEIEEKLHRILREGARDAGLSQEKLIKYEVSATHQEILKGLGETEEDRKHVFAFFRDPAPGVEEDSDLRALKQDLRNKLGNENICRFRASDSAKLCADAEELLSKVILAEAGTFKSRPALDLEMDAHEAFARDRARHFTGRKSVLDAIAAHVRGGDRRPLVVHGASGCGKSAIVAKASAQAKAEIPGAVLIQRFIGVMPDASSGITLLHSLCEQLSREYGVTEETPMGFQPLVVAFHERMARATAERPLVLFLDALDQLRSDDEARAFTWLRQNLPAHVSLVVSTTEIPAGLQNASQFAVGDFPVSEAEEVLAAWLADAKRKLQPEQEEKVLGGFAPSGLPLYLKLASEEARRWRSFDAAERCVLGSDVGGMIDILFDRLSEETNHGPIMVNRSLGFLAAGRYGMTEDEILDALAEDDKVWEDFASRAHHTPPARRLPVIVWSRLFLDLEPYLNERAAPGGNVMAFYHRQVAERAAWLYLRKDEGTSRHAELAKYFGKQSHWRNKAAMQANERKITELVRHQIGANALTDLETTLTDLDFIAAKCASGLVVDLEWDYRDARTAMPEAQAILREEQRRTADIARWTDGIIRCSHAWNARRDRIARGERVNEPEPVLPEPPPACRVWTDEEIEAECRRIRETPARLDGLAAFAGFVGGECYPLVQLGGRVDFVLQHAFNYAPGGPVRDAARGLLPQCGAPLLLRRWPKEANWNPKPAMLRTLEGHGNVVTSVSVTPDGRRAVSGSGDKTLRVWDLESGQCLRTLEGHSDSVESVSVTPDGRRAVSGSGDTTLRVWDLESGQCLRTLEGHSDWVWSVSVTPDGRRAVSGSGDTMLRVWDLESGACLRTLEGHRDSVQSVSVTPDGRRAVSGSEDKTLRVWDLESGQCERTLRGLPDTQGQSGRVLSVSVTPDGRRAVSGSAPRTLRAWNLESGQCERTLETRIDSARSDVWSVGVTPDGRRAVSGSRDKTLRVWDLESGRCERRLEGHSDSVQSVSVTPDGRRAVSGSEDGTLHVWNLESGRCEHPLDGHSMAVSIVSVTPDGRRAVSGSGDKTLRVWDLESGQCLRTLQGYGYGVWSVVPDGRRAVFGSEPRKLQVWDVERGRWERWLEGKPPQHRDEAAREAADASRVSGVSVTLDGRRAMSWSWRTLRVWDLESGQCLHMLEGYMGTVWTVTPDGRCAVSGNGDKTLRVWDLESGQCLRTLEGHRHEVVSVNVTPDGRRAVSGSRDKTLRVWDLESGQCLRTLEGHRHEVVSVNVTPDGRRAVSGSRDKTLRVWDLESGACLAVFAATAQVTAVAILGTVLAIGTCAGQVLLVEMRDPPPGQAIAPDASASAYEASLRRCLDRSRREKGPEHEETLAHLAGLAVYLERSGKTHEARSLREEHDRTDPRVAERIRQRAYHLYEQRGRIDGFDLDDWFQAELEVLGARKHCESR